MILNFFFNPKFEKLINELGVLEFGAAFSVAELTKLRDEARDGYGGTPEEAAARAFRDLIILNERIPVERRIEASFGTMTLLKLWHFDKKVNVDLHLGIKDSIEKLLSAYVGKSYEDDYFEALGKKGVITPITHDTFRTFAFYFLYGGKKASLSPNDAAFKFVMDVLIMGNNKYPACLTKEGLEAVMTIAAALSNTKN